MPPATTQPAAGSASEAGSPAISQLNATAWQEFYSADHFASAIAGTECHTVRGAWVNAITGYFATRQRQRLEPLEVHVTPLATDLALMTSREKADMQLKDGTGVSILHVFSMVWKKEKAGWRIIHSHESWTDEPSK